jgi:dimethylamine/trimethylamine dehydrogenase
MQFLMRSRNDRTDEYGGTLENRARLLRELIEETKDAVGDRCAVAVRLSIDELLGADGISHEGEGHDVIAMLAELPDLWDVNVSGWSNDSASSRFAKEGFQERYTRFVKRLTSKPVVGVGRFTSPDSMVSAIRRGVLDLIGAALPSCHHSCQRSARIVSTTFASASAATSASADMRSVPSLRRIPHGRGWRRGWRGPSPANGRCGSSWSAPAPARATRALGMIYRASR